MTQEFKEWWSRAIGPQGQYESWQWAEFKRLAWRAWQASRKAQRRTKK